MSRMIPAFLSSPAVALRNKLPSTLRPLQTCASSPTRILRSPSPRYSLSTKSTTKMTEPSPSQPAESQEAPPPVPTDMSAPTIFDKILAGDIPADVVYEDEETLAFRDINPQAPVHLLVIPKRRIPTLSATEPADKELLGLLLLTASRVAALEGLAEDGYRVIINNGPNGLQSVYHLHLHVIGGKQLNWGPF